MVVLLVDLEVFGQLLDPLGKKGYLHLRRSSVRFVGLEFTDDFLFVLLTERHWF